MCKQTFSGHESDINAITVSTSGLPNVKKRKVSIKSLYCRKMMLKLEKLLITHCCEQNGNISD